MPIYAILIAVGLISLICWLTHYRLSRLLIAVVLSLILVIPTTYQLISQRTLIQSLETGYMVDGDKVAKMLYDMLEPHDYIFGSMLNIAVLDYYRLRDDTDFQLIMYDFIDEDDFEGWQLGGGIRYIIDEHDITFLSLVDRYDIWAKLLEQTFVFEPLMSLTDQYYLYEISIPPTVMNISEIEKIDQVWFVGKQGVSYDTDDQMLTFDMHGDHWKILRYREQGRWEDYRLSARVKITETSEQFEELLIRFRESGKSSYSLAINISDESEGGGIGFRKDLDETFLGYFSSVPYTIDLNRWYDIVIDIEGDTFTVFIDGEQILQSSDLLFTQGTFGFLSPPDARVQIADIYLD
jgi:hypothetical protein